MFILLILSVDIVIPDKITARFQGWSFLRIKVILMFPDYD